MAGRIPEIGDFILPPSLITTHNRMTDSILESPDTGHTCLLIYPPIDSECPNCLFDERTNRSSGIYKEGGSVLFANYTTCPVCGGKGRSQESVTEEISLRIYFHPDNWVRPKEWKNLSIDAVTSKNRAQIIGWLEDLPKVQRASEIILNSNVIGVKRWRCRFDSEGIPWGFGSPKRYFVRMVKRI